MIITNKHPIAQDIIKILKDRTDLPEKIRKVTIEIGVDAAMEITVTYLPTEKNETKRQATPTT